MFNEFWVKNKNILEAAGLLTAIGAIFISISKPENQEAQIALFYIQMIWLIIITISVSLIMINFYLYFTKVEKKIEAKINSPYFQIDLLSSIILITAVFFIFFTWKYLILLYKDQLSNYLKIIGPMIGVTVFSFAYYINAKFTKYYQKGKIFLFYLFTFLEATLMGIFLSIWSAIYNMKFNINNSIMQTLITVVLFSSFCIIMNFISYNKKMKKV